MTLEEAVTANLGTLYSTNNSNDEYDLTNGLYIKMLIDDYKLSSSLNIVTDEKVILTTAGKKDKTFAYRGSNNTAQVTRESKEETPFVDSMFKVYGDLTLNNIILDGNKENVTALSNGGIIFDSGTNGIIFPLKYKNILENIIKNNKVLKKNKCELQGYENDNIYEIICNQTLKYDDVNTADNFLEIYLDKDQNNSIEIKLII